MNTIDTYLIHRARPNEGESLIDYQNRQCALRNRALSIQESRFDISDETFDPDNEPIII